MNDKIKYILGGAIVVLIGLTMSLLFLYGKERANYKEQANLYNAINGELQTWKDKDSLNNAKIQIIQTEKAETFLELKNLEGINLELQNLIKNQGKKIKDLNSALILKSETIIRDTTRLYYPIEGDTIIFSQSVLLDSIQDDWIDVVYGFNKGKSILDFTLLNEYHVTFGYEGVSLFKRGTPYAIVKNINPYTNTSDFKVYQVTPAPQKRFGLSLQTGFGGLYDIKNKNLGYGPYVGLGINYTILFW